MDSAIVIRVTASPYRTEYRLSVGETVQLHGPARLAIWECACGHHRCAERHRLASWQPPPEGHPLRHFLASAVKGPGKRLQTGRFVQGMLFALWAREEY